jgi:hypothetical protein
VEEHVAFELIYECTRGHEATNVVVHDAEDIDDHVVIRSEWCCQLSVHDTCPAFVVLDRIVPFDTRKDEDLRPTFPEDTQERVKA